MSVEGDLEKEVEEIPQNEKIKMEDTYFDWHSLEDREVNEGLPLKDPMSNYFYYGVIF